METAENGVAKVDVKDTTAAANPAEKPRVIPACEIPAKGSLLERMRAKSARKVQKTMRNRHALRRQLPEEWFRTHPDAEKEVIMFDATNIDGTGFHIVTPEVAEFIVRAGRGGRLFEALLKLCINLDGNTFINVLKVADNDWSTTHAEAIEASVDRWVYCESNRQEGYYNWATADEELKDPVWPDRSWDEIYETSIAGRVIDSPNHYVVQRLLYGK